MYRGLGSLWLNLPFNNAHTFGCGPIAFPPVYSWQAEMANRNTKWSCTQDLHQIKKT